MTSYIWPVDINTVSQEFGADPNPAYQPDGHTGMDFAVPVGTPVLSPADGTVLFCDWASKLGWPNQYYINPGFGNADKSAGIVTIIDHGETVSVSAHLSDNDMISVGQRVAQGQVVGLSGNTGFSSGPHLHFEFLPDRWDVNGKYYGRVNPRNYCSTGAPAPQSTQTETVGSNQRVTGPSGVIRRKEPKVADGNTIDNFGGDLILTLGGYIHGQSLTIGGITTDVWFKGGISGGYMWSGGFTSQSTDGLTDLTPAPPKTNVRITGPDGANRRTIADKSGTLIDTFGPDLEITIGGFVRADTSPFGDGNNIWFVGGLTGGFMWSGGFTSQSTDGLPDLTPPAGQKPVPAPPVPVYDFEPDFDWVEKIPAALTNVQRAADNPGATIFPATPSKDVIHQFGTLGRDTIGSAINEFKRSGSLKSAHFVVSGKRAVQMVSLKDRAYHAGPQGNDFVGIETDPLQDADTIATVRRLIADIQKKTGQKVIILVRHRDVPGNNTECGSLIDLSKYELKEAAPAPAPVTPAAPAPEVPTADNSEAAVLKRFSDWQIEQYLNRK